MSRRVLSIVVVALVLGLGVAGCGGKARAPATTPVVGSATAAPQPVSPVSPVSREPGDATPGGKALSDADVEELGGKMLGMMESVATAVEGSAADCGAMAAAVEQVIADNQAMIAEVNAADGNPDNAPKFETWMDKNKVRTDALTAKLGPGLKKCAADPKVQEAFSKLSL